MLEAFFTKPGPFTRTCFALFNISVLKLVISPIRVVLKLQLLNVLGGALHEQSVLKLGALGPVQGRPHVGLHDRLERMGRDLGLVSQCLLHKPDLIYVHQWGVKAAAWPSTNSLLISPAVTVPEM